MAEHRPPAPSPLFARTASEVRDTAFRDDLAVREIPAPEGLAPEAIALAGDVRPEQAGQDSPLGTGRFILLHDPASPAAWEGPWRIVCFAQAPLETDIGVDPMLADVTWSWLVDALAAHGAAYDAAAGTATKTISKGFGSLASEGDGAQIELRASWSPKGPIRPHLDAWAELVCMLAGLPPGSEGITMLGTRRNLRD